MNKIIQFPSSHKSLHPGPTSSTAADRPARERKSVARFLPSLDAILDCLLALYVFNMIGLVAALSLNDISTAFMFIAGMLGAGVAMVAGGVLHGARS